MPKGAVKVTLKFRLLKLILHSFLGEPGYDERTLLIPDWQWSKFTPFEKQFWEIKCQFFDTVVFFKKGKFFELYENDADIGAREFNLKMTDRINMRMAGVPEATFDFWAAKFVGKGYKVAKVDQLENAVSKTMREKSENSKAEKIIRRELASILTCGTLVDGNHLKSDNSNYCMSIKIDGSHVGAAFVDASSAKFFVSDFEDDPNFIILETLLSQIAPREIVFEKVPYSCLNFIQFFSLNNQEWWLNLSKECAPMLQPSFKIRLANSGIFPKLPMN